MTHQGLITLLTDFGWGDGYIGAVKGAILSVNPWCRIVDIAHGVSAHDVESAAFILGQTYRFFPQGTIHVAVVDPGVGGARRPVVVTTPDHLFVGPDNGVFHLVLEQEHHVRAYELVEDRYFLSAVSGTFHGRDVFGPAAAHLARGVPPDQMGPGRDPEELTRLSIARPIATETVLAGEVVYLDSFGNLITNIPRAMLKEFAGDAGVVVEIEGDRINEIRQTYSDAEKGELVALWGSAGFLEIALREGNLASARGWTKRTAVTVRRKP